MRARLNRTSALVALAIGVAAIAILAPRRAPAVRRARARMRDYSHRSGFPRDAEAMRGAARDFIVPEDYRTPNPLRPYPSA